MNRTTLMQFSSIMHIDTILSHLDNVKPTGTNKWLACCCSHDDRNPSLSICTGDDGRILLKCWAGCSIQDITAALGIEVKDLFPNSNLSHKEHHQYAQQKSLAEIETALLHELYILVQTVGGRVTSRQLISDHKFREIRPDWQPYPSEHWERELLATKRVKRGLDVVYG